MVTRFSFDKADTRQLKRIMELYVTKSRAQLATDILISMYKRFYDSGMYTRQYMLVSDLKDVPKSNIAEVLKDLDKIRAIRNEGAKGTISQYKPSLNQLGKSLKGHGKILQEIHNKMIENPKNFEREAVYSKIDLKQENDSNLVE